MKKFTTLFPSATKLHDQRETGSQHPKKEKLMTLLVIASLLFPFISQAQPLSGPKAIPGDYATLDVAIAALNADGVAAPGVTFNIGANQSLTGPVQIGSATLNASATMAAPVVINGGGFTISADFAGTLTGSNANGNNDAAIVINGTDYVTIQNCVFTEQASNTTTATAIEHAIAMYNASGTSPFDGCQNIHITGCTFSFGKSATNGAAIFSGPFVYLTTTNLTWGSYGASPGDMHRYIYVQNNTFNGSYNHIIFRGSTSGANGRALIVTDNTFTDIGGAGTTSYGTYTLYLDSLIYKNNIANTSVSQTTTSYIAFASTNSGGVQEAIGNTITLESGTTTSTTYGIYFTSVGVNRSMNNNTVKFGTFPNITSGTVYGLYGTYSGGNNNINFEMNGNICSNQTFPATTATSYVFYNNATAGTNRNIFMNGNTISNLTKDNSGTLYLIYPGTANTVEVANNTITNITRNNNSASGAATTYGIYASNTATTMSVHDNTVENIAVSGSSTSTAGILRGIYATPASTSTATYYNNIIHDLSFGAGTHTGQVNGFYFTGGAATVADVYKNKIYNLNANQASGTAYGIYHNAGTTNIFNNLIGNITTPDANAAIPLAGIYVAGGTTVNLDFNTIYLNATSTGALFGSMAVYASTTPTLTMRNNILINLSTPTGAAGYSSAYRRSTTTLTTYGADSNNNLFYAGTPGPNNLIFYDGSNADQTLADFKTRVTPRDAVSVSGNPTFLSTTGSSADFLHLDPSVPTQTESGGTPVAGITDDYDGNVRNVSTPDIGADEFTGIAIDITPPNIIYTPLATVCTTGARTLTATITDASGVPTAGAGLPVLYWSLNAPAGPFTAATATSLGGDQYEFTFGGTAMLGDNVYYYIAAQDNVAPPNVGTSPSAGSGGYMANPPAASTPPSPPASYGVQAPFTGTYTVGAAGNFATLTDAVDFYNTTPCLAGPVVFELIDASYPSETFPIVIMENPNASATNTLTIRPAAANAVTISGTSGATASALIRLNGADYVIIDGVNTGGAKLIIENTSTTAGTAVIWLSSNGAGLGATNNQIKNCELKAGITQNTSTSNTYGVVVAGSTLSSSITSVTAGNDNDNNVVSGNTITKVRYGVYFRGGATANPNTGSMITNNIIGPGAFGTEQIGKGGIIAREEDGIVITGNEVRFVGGDYDNLTTGTDRAGIAFATDATWTPSTVMVKNATVTGNNIHDVVDERTFSAVGMLLAGVDGGNPTNNLVANNFISNIKANGTGTDQAVGIAVTGGNEDLIVYNSINMTGDTDPNASAAAPSQSNYGIRLSSTTTTNPTIKNNVIVNDLTSSSTPAIKNGCIDIPVSFAWGSGGSNFNVLYVNNLNPQSYAGSTGSTGGTFFATLLDWQTATSQDANSLSQDPKFIGVTDLHIDPAGTPVESGAMPIPGVTTDYDGNTRNVTTPDIGADEGNFVLLDLTGPGISYTNIPNSICIDALSLSADITDASGVNVAGGTKPRLWYKKSTEMNVLPATNTSADDGWKYVEASNASSPFIFNVDYSLLTSAVTSGDVIEYFAVAQDLVVTPNVGTNTAIYNSAPTSVALGAGAFPVSGVKSYSIIVAPVTINSQATPSTICISGDVTLSLAGDPSTGATYQWQSSPMGAGTWSNIGGATTATYLVTGVTASTDYRCVISCGGGPIAASPSSPATVVVSSPMVLSTTAPAPVCGTGPFSVALAATVSGGATAEWYAAPSGGTSLYSGSPFNTPPISTTTTYYVAASEGGSTTTIPGDGAWNHFTTAGTFQTTLITSAYMILTVTTPLTLSTMDIYPSATLGTAFTIEARTGSASGTTFATWSGNTTVVNSGTPTVAQTVPVNWVLPVGTYYIGFVTTNPNTWRSGLATHPFPYVLPGVVSVDYYLTPSYQYYFYNLMVTTGCESARTPVTASVGAETNTWNGNGNGTTWDDPANWSDGIVPLPCQNVVIPSGDVTVPTGFEGKGLTLDVVPGALLTVPATGLLDIKP